MALTDRSIRAVQPTANEQRIADGNGLYLRVQPNGRKTFVFRSRVGGRASLKTLGTYPTMPLLEARVQAQVLLDASAQAGACMTVRSAFEAWHPRLKIATKDALKWRMEKYVLPKLGSRPLAEVHRKEVATVLIAAAKTAPVGANKALGDTKQLFAYAVEVGWLDASPVALLTRKVVGGPEASRARVLTDTELRDFIRVLRTPRFADSTRCVLALLLLSGQRSGEVRSMTGRDFDGVRWVLPRSKTGSGHTILLPKLGRQLLRWWGTFNVPNMPGQVLSRAVSRTGVTWTPHDLRRTMATRMADMGVAPHVIEKCLNHKMGGVMEIYNRSEYLPEKAHAWRLWTRYLLQLRRDK